MQLLCLFTRVLLLTAILAHAQDNALAEEEKLSQEERDESHDDSADAEWEYTLSQKDKGHWFNSVLEEQSESDEEPEESHDDSGHENPELERAAGVQGEDLSENDDQHLENNDESMSQEQLQGLHKLWDTNGDGKASLSEVLHFANEVKMEQAEESINASLAVYDTSKDGMLSLKEISSRLDDQFSEDEYQRFQLADKNGDGVLGNSELMSYFNPEATNETIRQIAMDGLRAADTNQDGKLTELEFLQLEGDGAEADWERAEQEFQGLDKSGDGALDINELMRYVSGASQVENAITNLFNDADKDKDGLVNVDELAAVQDLIVGSSAHNYLVDWVRFNDL